MEDGFTAESFAKETDTSAYTVNFHNGQHQFHPRLDRMPGLERLLDRFDIDGYPTLTQSRACELRRRTAKALNRDSANLNAMSFTEIADALEVGDYPTRSASPPDDAVVNTPNGPTEMPPRPVNAWSALADRFAALAAEQDFDLWLYSISEHHYPPNFGGQTMRFRSTVPQIQARTGFTGLALVVSPKRTAAGRRTADGSPGGPASGPTATSSTTR